MGFNRDDFYSDNEVEVLILKIIVNYILSVIY